MPNTMFLLGGYAFSGWGVPERVNGGGQQNLAVHRMIGGARVIDAMGWNADQIHFSGRFRGAAATINVRLLETLARLGVPVVFSYWTNRYQVVVAKFKWQFERFYEVSYSLSLEVLVDLTQDVWVAAISTLDDLFNADLSLLTSVVSTAASFPVALTGLASAQAQVGLLQDATPIELKPLTGSVATASSQLQTLQTSLDTGLPLGTAGGVGATGDPEQLVTGLVAQTSQMQQLATTVQASAITTRMQNNLETASP